MADHAKGAAAPQPNLLQRLTEAGKKAFDPASDEVSRKTGMADYSEIIDKAPTWPLLHALNSLIKPGVVPPWLSKPFMQALTSIPLRSDGVRATMEFVFSVHPSNANAKAESVEAQKQGAGITHEAVAVATRLLSSVPASMTPQAWFEGISSQLFDLVDGKDGPDLARTTAQIIGFGFLGKRSLGAPGAPGWNVFVQPLLEDINPSLKADPLQARNDWPTDVVDLTQDRVLTTAASLSRSLQRIRTLVVSNPSPGLCRRVLKPIIVQTWILASLQQQRNASAGVSVAARSLLSIYVQLFGSIDTLSSLRENVLCKGAVSDSQLKWQFQSAADGEPQVVVERPNSGQDEIDWQEIDSRTSTLVDIMGSVGLAEDVSALFRELLQSWIASTTVAEKITVSTADQIEDPSSAVQQLLEMTLLQKLLEQVPEKLVSDFDQLLELITRVFTADQTTWTTDELMGVVLSLLNLVITAPTFKESDIKPEELAIVHAGLSRLSKENRAVSQTASNLSMLLKYRGDMDEEDNSTSAPSRRQVEDRRVYNLAINYITEADNPPPVVSEGLNLLSGLIMSESPTLDITATLVLMSNLLANNEDYINLRVVKIFTQLAGKHPKSTVSELLDHYVDAQEKSNTDNRLRFGEALLQVIERLGETFTGQVAKQIGEALLAIAGRRGFRPKTKAKQARDERIKEMKRKKGSVEEEDDDDEFDEEDITEDAKGNNEILAQIVRGWDSKRGSEDIRMRASALSIFGRALETSVSGLGPTLASGGVDLSVSILTLEPEIEKAILRRSAIIAILSFVRALQDAKETSRSLGFGLTDTSRQDIVRTLEYVVGTDNDGLVQQHARDVIETLENWQLTTLLPQQTMPDAPELGKLAGLSVNPDVGSARTAERPRPRIEEIE